VTNAANARAGLGELPKRVLVALVGIPVVLWALYAGDAVLATLLAVFSALGAREFFRLAQRSGVQPLAPIGVVLAAVLPLLVHGEFLGVFRLTPHLVTIGILTVLTLFVVSIWGRGVDGKPLLAVGATILGVLYVGATLSYAYALRYFVYAIGDIAGMLVVMIPIVITWASDTGAYFTGRLIGGPKLIPSVSPAKTISGAVGGVALSLVAGELLVHFLLRPYAQLAFSPWGLVAFAVGISVVAQLGDLVESLLKRSAGVKDSGVLLPGHGGVLDRLDSLFFVLPVAFGLYQLLLIPAPR
jgi:phosphatidate cytidylyltransferase